MSKISFIQNIKKQNEINNKRILEKVLSKEPKIYTIIPWEKGMTEPNHKYICYFYSANEAVSYVEQIMEKNNIVLPIIVDQIDIYISLDNVESTLLNKTQIAEILAIENQK
jgi:hypothetical protein